jgi:hypothetical protein
MNRKKQASRSTAFLPKKRAARVSIIELYKSELSGVLCIVYPPEAPSWQSRELFRNLLSSGISRLENDLEFAPSFIYI